MEIHITTSHIYTKKKMKYNMMKLKVLKVLTNFTTL